MSKLTLHRSIATGLCLVVLFDCAFAAILISGHI